ncbi:hypothetical protein Lnau_1318 [Legionella nautarum]|uniref:Uncharacterized protein n=1 Tax=Legionella nautarum TaxID=45070 RepID=A0A0W0WVJ2_9GAMM|nr:hypothetical protein [Legionella nautarum]KTD36334.1 hypothetical protein Lnau_1318 [Legionella nautarum]
MKIEQLLETATRAAQKTIIGSSNYWPDVEENEYIPEFLKRYFSHHREKGTRSALWSTTAFIKKKPKRSEKVSYEAKNIKIEFNHNWVFFDRSSSGEFALRDDFDALPRDERNLKKFILLAAAGRTIRYGNCSVINAYIAWVLWDMVFNSKSTSNPIVKIEIVSHKKFDHEIVVINRPLDSKLKDPSTWGKDCWIVDGWRGATKAQSESPKTAYYPATELHQRMTELNILATKQPRKFAVRLSHEINPAEEPPSKFIERIDFHPLVTEEDEKRLRNNQSFLPQKRPYLSLVGDNRFFLNNHKEKFQRVLRDIKNKNSEVDKHQKNLIEEQEIVDAIKTPAFDSDKEENKETLRVQI